MKIARVTTVPFFLYNHLRGQISATVEAGHEVVLVSSDGPEVAWLKEMPGVRFVQIEIPRKILPFRDLLALWKLYLLFRRERFDIVHSATPKAGMLCAMAGCLARIPIRLHTFTGQAWAELHGIMRTVAKAGDKVTAMLDTRCYADSFSQRDFIAFEGIVAKEGIRVLGAGSLAGVDLSRFSPAAWVGSRAAVVQEMNLPSEHKIIIFIGRITRDKGIEELVAAFELLRHEGQRCSLLLVGPDEQTDGESTSRVLLSEIPDIHWLGYCPQPERYLAASEIFCLPSYREGFGNVVIEAAAMGVPTVGTDIVGLSDAIIDGETGLLVQPKNARALADALKLLLENDELRKSMGEKARIRAVDLFDARKVNAAVLTEYRLLSLEVSS